MKGFKILMALVLCQLISQPLYGNSKQRGHLLGVGQGISLPTLNSTINFSNGYTFENPVGVAYQTRGRLSLQADLADDAPDTYDGYGGELGFGNGYIGLAGGYYERDCDTCEGAWAGALGISLGPLALGLRFGEELYGAGILINPQGKHRLGVVGVLDDRDEQNPDISSLGIGYSYVGQQVSFTLDASKQDFEDPAIDDSTLLVSPGLAIYLQKVAFSITYDHYLDEPEGSTLDDDLWFGLEFGKAGSWSLALYHDYVNEWSASLSFFF